MNQTKEHIQNIILFFTDILCLLISYYGAGIVWLMGYKGLDTAYAAMRMNSNVLIVVVAYIIVYLCHDGNKGFISRQLYDEFKASVLECALIGAVIAILELLFNNSETQEGFSRGIYVFMIIIGAVLILAVRCIVKRYIINGKNARNDFLHMLVVTTSENVEKIEEQLNKKQDWTRKIIGFTVIDKDMTGQMIGNIPVVANSHTMIKFIKNEIVDEVYINVPYDRVLSLQGTVQKLEDMGVTVHIKLAVMEYFSDFAASFGKINDIPVVTFANRFYDYRALAVKRMMDIAGSLVGIVIMLIAMIFVAPAIKLESKGPLFFKQKRVGKNGRYFYIYKFRSMYIDAEERKKELMAQNEMSGLMFKMKDDPRITKVGKFIRKTSIDELPQFINVLKGDMSLIGTRPPTVGEFKQYGAHHKRRLSMKPGITGMWQAYGRNTVEDFEDVVKMDLDYIDNWSLGMDIRILFKTIAMVFTEGGK